MKIAMALEKFGRHAGGAESYAVELAQTLVSEGWEVHLYGHTWDGQPPEAVFHPIPSLPQWIPPSVRILDFALRHRGMVQAEHFDVILGFGNTLVMNAYQSHGGVHYFSSVRKLQAVRNPVLRLLKAIALFAAPKYHARAWIESAPFRLQPRPVIIAIADMVRNDMAEYFRVDKDTIRLVYNGINQERFGRRNEQHRQKLRKSWGFHGNDVLFLFMAYDFRKKGVRYLVEAAGKLRKEFGTEGWGLVVAGRAPSPMLTGLTERLDLRRNVVFPGPTRQPEAFYGASDVFVLPTFYDACSLVVFEAMAAGLPVITTKFNGAAGVITDGQDGSVLADPRDTDRMAASMSTYLDRDYLASAASAAQKTSGMYTLKKNHAAMLRILNEVAQHK
jgi:UDP-glucose:(heptosyl)LPS alpha-1,3-glucosyltransferase